MTRKRMDLADWKRFVDAMERSAGFSTFEGAIEHLEAVCQRTPGAWPNRTPDARPPERSRAWYAEEILFALKAARHHLAHGRADYAAREALLVGAMAAEAQGPTFAVCLSCWTWLLL